MPYSVGVSVFGSFHVFLTVEENAKRSMLTAMITEMVGSLVNSQGIMPTRAMIRQYVSIRRMFLKPYLSDNRKMMTVNISDAAVESAPIPAPRATCPKKTMHDTIVHTSQVNGCGLTFFWMISRR